MERGTSGHIDANASGVTSHVSGTPCSSALSPSGDFWKLWKRTAVKVSEFC